MNEPKKGTRPRGRAHNWNVREVSRQQLVPRVAELTGLTYQTVDQVVDVLLDQIRQTVAGGKPVQFRGFGRWWLQQLAPKRMPAVPTRGERFLPARKKLRFKAAPKFQQMLPGWKSQKLEDPK